MSAARELEPMRSISSRRLAPCRFPPSCSRYGASRGITRHRAIDATSTRRPGASKYRTALGSGPGRKPLTASFSQSGSSPSRSATVAADRVRSRVLRTTGGCRRRRAGPESYPAQSAGGDEDAPRAKGRGGLLKCGRVHPTQRRHEPPPAGISPRLARPRGERPVVTSSKVLRQCGERSVYLSGTCRRWLVTEPPGGDHGTGACKIMV